MSKRYIESYESVDQFPLLEEGGTMAWDETNNAMYFFNGVAWQAFGGGQNIFETLTYDTVKAVSVLDIPDTFQEILTLVTPERAAGKYVLGISVTWTFADTNDSAYMRWRIDGGPWVVYTSEPQDVTDQNANYYEFPDDYAQGTHTITVEARKEDQNANDFDINYIDLFFQRVG